MNRSNTLLILIMFLTAIFVVPSGIVNAKPPLQSSGAITGHGQICNDQGSCGAFELTFNPEGGEVNGSYSGTFVYSSSIDTLTTVNTSKITGTLTGTFTGGDGGLLEGNAAVNNDGNSVINGVDSQGFAWTMNEPDVSTYAAQWNGNLYANGTGSGWVSNYSWSIIFDANDFTHEKVELSTPTEEVILPTPTNNDVVGKKFDLLPETKAFIASSPDVNDATKEIFNQDAAIIVRDQNNQFYAINNNGKPVALPPVLNSYFGMSNQFAVLGNDKWLASSEHGSIRGAINGSGDFVLLDKIPPNMKDHDYTMLATNCSTSTECNPVMKINSTASSTKIAATCLLKSSDSSSQTGMNVGGVEYISSPGGKIASSEHGSCRGTINGGGDFIYEPQTVILASYVISSSELHEGSSNPGYLGVLVESKSDGAEIIQIQPGSPAAVAGLEIGDKIANVSGTTLDDQHTLGSVLGQFKGGEEVILGILRNGEISAINLSLAKMGLPVIETPSAIITLNENTELVVDIGFNGVSGVLVLADSAHVIEPITGTEIEVPAGNAVIVVPGETLDTVYTMTDSDVNKWWENPSTNANTPPDNGNSSPQSASKNAIKSYKDFNPIPGLNSETLYWGGWFLVAILYFVIFMIKLFKKP